MSHRRLLLVLVLLCAPTGGALRFYDAATALGCLNTALEELPEGNAVLEKRGFGSFSKETSEELHRDTGLEEEELGKRTFPQRGHSKYIPQARPKGKTSQNGTKGDRRAKVTLSLDVPTNIMNILFNIAKAKNLRAKAAANAHLMAQIGRRK